MKRLTSFAEVNEYLVRFHDQSRTKYTLDNMLALMDFLGNPQEKFKVVHVAGTSGKTSTAYYAAALLSEAGRKTGLTISPHVDEINQRVQLNMQPLPEPVFCQALSEFLSLIETSPVRPSWFELMVAFAYWYFAREGVDYAVVEVGLGGLKDGTNVMRRADKVCVITDISFDHMKVLGNSLGEIATQKLGIVHAGNAVFMYEQDDEIMKVARQVVAEQSAELNVIDFDVEQQANKDDLIVLPLYQLRNWLLAHRVYSHLQARDKLQSLTRQALQKTQAIQIPGRMDVQLLGGKTIVMDGAHNAQKMAAFVSSFQALYPGVKPAVLISLKEGKEYEQIVPLLLPIASRVITTSFESSQDLPVRSIDPQTLANAFRAAGAANVESIPNQAAAVNALLNSEERSCVITGSFYLLGQIRNNRFLV